MIEIGENYILCPSSFESMLGMVTEKEHLRFAYLLESFGVKFYHHEGHDLRPPVVHVEAAVIINKNIGITVPVTIKGPDFVPYPALWIRRSVDIFRIHTAGVHGFPIGGNRWDPPREGFRYNVSPIPEIR